MKYLIIKHCALGKRTTRATAAASVTKQPAGFGDGYVVQMLLEYISVMLMVTILTHFIFRLNLSFKLKLSLKPN